MDRYKITLAGKTVYKEIELSPEAQHIRVGTGVDCEVRLRKELFFGAIELLFVKNGDGWAVHCSDNLYLTTGDIRKLMIKNLTHGDMLEVRYQESDNLLFTMDFLIDFDAGAKNYERIIELSQIKVLTIGAFSNCNIALGGKYVKSDDLVLRRRAEGFILDIKNSAYGIYLNGKKAQNSDLIADGDFLSVCDYFFYFKDNKLFTQNRPDMKINSLSYLDLPSRSPYPKFVRNTRMKTFVCDEKIEILDPPAKPQKPKNNLLMRLLPSLGMLLAAGVMAYMGGMMIIMSVVSGGMAVFTTILGVREGNKDYKEDSAKRIEQYNNYIEKKRQEIEDCRKQEHDELEELYISQDAEIRRIDSFSTALFDREKDDEDFLCLRLGSGDVPSKREIEYKKQEKLEIEDDLQLIPEQLCLEYKNVSNAPVVCDLKEINALGVVGQAPYRFDLLKNMVIDLVARQYFSDVKMVFVAKEEHKEQINWLRFLPYVRGEEGGLRNIVCDDESRNAIFEYLFKELTEREQSKLIEEQIVVFFYDEYGFKSHPISKFVDKAKDLGVTFIFFGDRADEIPQGCGYVVSIRDNTNASLINAEKKSEVQDFIYPHISTEKAREIVNFLAPVYTEEISLEGSLTKNITLFELLNIFAVDDIDLKSRWETSKVFNSMAAPLGVSKTGVVSLDLHDKAHGPHGLVAGTTGSGKSEILQSYILSMATLFHPYEVAFVIIDFKGGGMVNQFKELPHLLGAITNIDGKEINRSLKSIKAELQKRQRLFAEADVNHIDKYIKKYKAGEAKEPLPHLIIIVDEFAELKAEQPEFMKELISAARIGRSLGVHLILATQKPSGQVDEQIWSNSRFKLCLKVQSQGDSNEVLKSPLAAEIKEPGRAYLQVGNNEIFELFQSAYSGASEKADDSNVKEFALYSLTEAGKKTPVYVQKKSNSGEESTTQLDAIVGYVADYCAKAKLPKLQDICLPSLSQCIDYESDATKKEEHGVYSAEIGVFDDPDNQYQGVHSVDLSCNNLMIIGSSLSGKTNVLQSIIRSLATKYSPEEVNLYIIDFASRVLKTFEGLGHVGGVVCPSEDEKLKNLFKLLASEIETRKEKLMSVGVSSFAAYKEAGQRDLPLIVLLIDNMSALQELYFNDNDELLNLCREGLTVGISVVIANAQTSGIGYKYLSNFAARIALYCNDSNEYSSLFDYCSERIENIPGRCIVERDKMFYECQSYLAFKGEKEIDRVQEIKNFITYVNSNNKSMMAKRIPLIPASLTKGFIMEQFTPWMKDNFSVVAGLDYASVSPFVFDFAQAGVMGVVGREGAGRHNWLIYSIDMLETMYPGMTKVYLVDSISKRLAPLKENESTFAYTMLPEEGLRYVKEIEMQLKDRYDALVAGDETVLDEAPLIMLVIENRDAMTTICEDFDGMESYKNITTRYKNMRVCIIAFADNVNISYSDPEILRNIRDQRNLMYFDDMSNMKVFDVTLDMSRNFRKPIEPGDGYYIKDNECIKLKTPICVKKGGNR